MRPNFLGLVVALLLGLPPVEAGARELFGPEAGVTPFGMGRAYSAAADDWLALHYNPAGLAMVEGVDLQLTDLKLGASKDAFANFGDYKQLGEAGDSAQKLQTLSGKQVHANLSSITQLTLPKFAFAMIYDYNVGFDFQNNVYPKIRLRNTQDFGFIGGTGFGVGKSNNRQKALRVGVAMKYLKRRGGVRDLTVARIGTESDSFLSQFEQEGWGVGATLGMQYQIPVKSRVEYTVSFVYHDIGHTSFGKFHQAERPTRIEQNMVAGLMVRFPIGGKANRRQVRRFGQPRSANHFTITADYSHLNISPDKEHFPKHLHFGINIDLPIVSVQAGWNQSSPTFGVGVDFKFLRVSAASYAEDLGGYAGQKVDRRYLISVGTGFGLSKF